MSEGERSSVDEARPGEREGGREERDPDVGPSAAAPGGDAVAVDPEDVPDEELAAGVADFAQPFGEIGEADLSGFLRRASGARVVLLGASTHGTSEFQRMRSVLTEELVAVHGFDFVALEADWEDAARIDRYVRGDDVPESEWTELARFPEWAWRNEETRELVESLRDYNGGIGEPADRVGIHGLDLYGMAAAIDRVVDFLEGVDAEAAREARARYARLAPWRETPGLYPTEAGRETMEECEEEVTAELRALLDRRLRPGGRVSDELLEAVQSARVVAEAEHFYRLLYRAADEAWNVRERHMMDTLRILMAHHGPEARGIVWAHNAHVGDASATSMGRDGRTSLGELCRELFDRRSYLVGQVTDRGTVAAASRWNGPTERKELPSARGDSWEHLLTLTGLERALVPIWHRAPPTVRERLADPRPERAVGAIYQPQDGREPGYLHAALSGQFDEVVWFEETSAVTPLETEAIAGEPGTYPSGL